MSSTGQGPVKVALVVGILTLLVVSASSGVAMMQRLGYAAAGPAVTTTTVTGEPHAHTLSTDGTGKATLSPDKVQIDIGDVAQASTAGAAADANAKVISAVLAQLATIGIGNSSISTVAYSVAPLYDYKSSPPTIYTYQAVQTLQVTLQSPNINQLGARVSRVIDLAVGAGANQVSQVTFTLSDQTMKQANSQALQAAIQDASAKAQLMASALNVKILGVSSISSTTSVPPIRYYAAQKDVFGGATGAATSILPGNFSVSATVQVSYDIG